MTETPASLVVDEIVKALQSRPETFSCSEYTLTDKRSEMEFWISNGFGNAGIYRPFEMKFGYWQGRRFHKALLNWKAWYAAKMLRDFQKADVRLDNA